MVFNEDRAEFTRQDGNLTTVLEVLVSAEDDAEVRRVSITNNSTRVREIDVTSYAELVLAPELHARELTGILDWIEQLNEVDTDGVEPMTTAVHATLPLREDVVTDGGDPERVLANAPKRAGNFFVAPKVIE